MEAKAIKKSLQKNMQKMMPKMTPNYSQRGPQNTPKIVKNDVLKALCFKGGSQMASRAPPGVILDKFWFPNDLRSLIPTRFWKGFTTILQPFLTIFRIQRISEEGIQIS